MNKLDLTLRIEDKIADRTGAKKTVLWAILKSKKAGYESIVAVNEIPEDSVLYKEVRQIADGMVELRRRELQDQSKQKNA